MVLIDSKNWLKAGIEVSDGHMMLSSVLTTEKFDSATAAYTGDPHNFWLPVTVANGVLRVQASWDKKCWPLVRLAPFSTSKNYLVGPMACTPSAMD